MGWNSGTISGSYSTGSVSANGNDVGGLVGRNAGTVSGSYSTGSANGYSTVGGLVGVNNNGGTVSGSYSTGSVSGYRGGGLVGDNYGSVSDSYWDTETSGQSTSVGGIGKTTIQMKTQSTFSGWDFSNTWNIQDGSSYYSYPYLRAFTYDTPEADPAVNPIPGLFKKKYSGGFGTVGYPYQIATTADLIELSNTSSDWTGKYFIQTADIAFDAIESTVDWDGNGTVEWSGNDQYGFSPIGNNDTNFTGSYNGQNHTISNLYINRTNGDYIALFGRTGSGSTLSNIGLLDVYVSGHYYVGGLVGANTYGTVSDNYSTGSVSGNDDVGGLVGVNNNGGTVSGSYSTGSVSGDSGTGGLVGDNNNGGTVSGSYSTGSVSGYSGVGGLVGYNGGTVSGSYSTGSVSGGNYYVGGLVGDNYGSVSDSYWDIETSGQNSSAGGTGKTTIQMKTQGTFSGWGFSVTWNIGSGNKYRSYPYLKAFTYDTPEADPAVNPIPGLEQKYSGGSGTSLDPYQISTTADLIELSNTSSDWTGKYFIQTADISFDADESTVDWDGDGTVDWNGNDQYGFSPIGNYDTNFTGSYNGQNHTISNLYIKRASSDYIGLFGQTGSGSAVSNIGLLDVYISGNYYVGGLVGVNGGTVSYSYSTGSVSGTNGVGGLVGWNDGTVSGSYSTGSVSASSSDVGGLVGENSFGGTVSGSYSTGSVSGTNYVGGLVGWNDGTVSGSYSTGSVSGTNGVGGLVGFNMVGTVSGSYSTGSVSGNSGVGGLVGWNDGTVSGSYWDIETSGKNTSAGGTGKTTLEMKTQGTFSGWDFADTWNIKSGGLRSYPYLKAFTYDIPGTDPAINPIPGLEQKYSSGSGTSLDPYQISTTADLIELSNTSSDWGKYFVQTADIAFDANESTVDWDGNGTVEWSGNDLNGFSPIGNGGTEFTGNYNGQNHTISNLYIKRTSTYYTGLFGQTGSGSTVSNIGLLDVYVSGNYYVGGLVGYNNGGTVSGSYSTGSVNASGSSVGGLVGINGGSVSGSYSTGSVSASGSSVGGLVGFNMVGGTVSDSYSTGSVSGGSSVGGLVGGNGGTVSSCYWDMQTSGHNRSADGTGKTTAEMKTQATFSGWDFTSTWDIKDGSSYYSYPYLKAFTYDTPGDPAVNPIPGLSNCITLVFVDASYNNSTLGWNFQYFSDIATALSKLCDYGTLNLAQVSKTTHTGNLDFGNKTVILGSNDFELTGNITGGNIQTTSGGKLTIKGMQANTIYNFPITDGTHNYSVTISTASGDTPDISIRINSNNNLTLTGSISSDFIDISGPNNLFATVTMRVDKAAIAPKVLNSTSQIRFCDSNTSKYVPVDGNNCTIEDMGTYYKITLTNVNKF